MTTLSPSADRVRAAIFDAMQAAEEIGGVESVSDYAALMSAVITEAAQRISNAHEAERPTPALSPEETVCERVKALLADADGFYPVGIEIIGTGGGCTAIQIPLGTSDRTQPDYWLITDAGGAVAPESETVRLAVGLYCGRESGYFVCFEVPDLAAAVALMRGYASSSFGS
jgi:hypothetical protein